MQLYWDSHFDFLLVATKKESGYEVQFLLKLDTESAFPHFLCVVCKVNKCLFTPKSCPKPHRTSCGDAEFALNPLVGKKWLRLGV